MESQRRSWVERVKQALASYQEALEFLARARQQFPMSSPAHAPMVTKLWAAAEELDPAVCARLDELNQGLLEGRGEVDTTRGVSLRQERPTPLALGQEPPGPGSPVYTCNWSLQWERGAKGVAVSLQLDPESGLLSLRLSGQQSRESLEITYPSREDALEDALAQVYVAEAMADRVLQELQDLTRALQAKAGLASPDQGKGPSQKPRPKGPKAKQGRGHR